MLLPDTFILPATNAEPSAPSNPSPASSTSTATASPGSTPTYNLRIQHRSTQGRPKAQHHGCSYAICAHHAILLSIDILPPTSPQRRPCATKTFFEVFFNENFVISKKKPLLCEKVTRKNPYNILSDETRYNYLTYSSK